MTAEPPFSRLRVLVVEDEPDTLATLLETLNLLGHSGTGVRSAEMARARYLDGAFDVLLTDVGLPAVSGRELVEVLSQRSPDLQVIYASGLPRPGDEAAPWLTKPYSIDELDAALKQAAGRIGRPD